MKSLFSSFRSYFTPGGDAPFGNTSVGLITRNLYHVLSKFGDVSYIDVLDDVRNVDADLYVGHFWSFARMARATAIRSNIALYLIADMQHRRDVMRPLEELAGVREPEWDLPPDDFDQEETLARANVILIVGNSYTRSTFDPAVQSKVHVLNYSLDRTLFHPAPLAETRREFCYPATHHGLRKGFLDVLDTWREIDPRVTRLHAIGRIDDTWRARLAASNNGSIVHHGYIDSRLPRYQELLRGCRFAYVPTVVEGQMGTLLEAIFSGCVPITTRASGVDDEVLEHCLVVEPRAIEQHRVAIETALSWSDAEYAMRRDALLAAAKRRHSWGVFREGVRRAVAEAACPG